MKRFALGGSGWLQMGSRHEVRLTTNPWVGRVVALWRTLNPEPENTLGTGSKRSAVVRPRDWPEGRFALVYIPAKELKMRIRIGLEDLGY